MSNTTPFGASLFMTSILRDEAIPASAVPAALAVATHVHWRWHKLNVPVGTIARRLGVTTDYVEDTVAYMQGLGYLQVIETKPDGRNVYRPRLPKGTPAQRGDVNAGDKAA